MVIRRETREDRDAADAVTWAAFGRPKSEQPPPETLLLRALRRDTGWIPTLSMVAVRDDRIVGHVVCTPGWVGEITALGLGPISVLPGYQRQGIGHALMHAIIGAADASGEALIAVLGDRHFYGRFGFVPASRLAITGPDPGWGCPLSGSDADRLPAVDHWHVSICPTVREHRAVTGRVGQARNRLLLPRTRRTHERSESSSRVRRRVMTGIAHEIKRGPASNS